MTSRRVPPLRIPTPRIPPLRRRAPRTPTFRPGLDARAQFHPPREPAPTRWVPTDGRDRPRVVVVGGGIAGLTAALALAERGVAVTVIEREPQLGGRVAAWPVDADGSPAMMSRGFHAFFRQYYNLRAVLRRTDPTLTRLQAVPDYPLVRAGGASDSFAGIPRTPPLNLLSFVVRSPSFTTAGLLGVDVPASLGMLDVSVPEIYRELEGVSAAEVLDRLHFPREARHVALEVFARSFFADPADFSGAELLAMFHLYFVGSSEGLLFDVPEDDYDKTLWAPLGAHLAELGVEIVTQRTVSGVRRDDHGFEVRHHSASDRAEDADGDVRLEPADAVVLALDPVALREIVAASTDLGSPAASRSSGATRSSAYPDLGRSWRDSVARVQESPNFVVWRGWLSGPVHEDRPAFLGTSGYDPLDVVAVVDRFEAHARAWSREHGGSVVEAHAYALPDDLDLTATRESILAALRRVYPEMEELTVRHEELLVRRDNFLPGLNPWDGRPGVSTPDPHLVLAGDAVRCPLPVALMERAATTGWQAADQLLTGWGLPGHGVWSVPTTPRLGRTPRLLRRALGGRPGPPAQP